LCGFAELMLLVSTFWIPAEVITARHTERQTTLVVRTQRPVDDPAWAVGEIGLEDMVLAYMRADAAHPSPMEVVR